MVTVNRICARVLSIPYIFLHRDNYQGWNFASFFSFPLVDNYFVHPRKVPARGGTIPFDLTINVEASTSSPFGGRDEKRSGIWQLFPVCKFTVGDECVYPYLSRLDSRRVRAPYHRPPRPTIASTSISVHSSVPSVRTQTDPFLAVEAKSRYGKR